MDRPARILIVDDEESVLLSLRKALMHEGWLIQEAGSGKEALQLLSRLPFDLVLTDIKMEEVSGLELLAEIKHRWPGTVVILLTGYGSLESAIQALRQGAHDYLLKPVSIHEVRDSVREGLAKRRKALRQQELLATLRESILELSRDQGESPSKEPQEENSSRWLRVGDLVVDRARHSVTIAGTPVSLTPTEFRLLVCLLDNRDRVLRYQELVREVHGYECDPYEAKQLIMPHVSNLRQKLRTGPESPSFIKNVRGVGYIFSIPEG